MRIRSIKPEFWRSADIDALDWHQRLIFIGLWSYVDDNGVGDARVASIAADLFAHDLSVDPTETLRRVSLALDVLESRGMVVRYDGPSTPLLYVINWERHQVVKNPSKGKLFPLPPAEMLNSSSQLRRPSVDTTETHPTGTGEQGNRGTGEQTPPNGGVARTRGTRIPDPFIVDSGMREWAAKEVPNVDVDRATRKFVDYWRAVSGAKGTKLDWTATWRNWLRNDSDRQPVKPRLSKDARAQSVIEMGRRLREQEAGVRKELGA